MTAKPVAAVFISSVRAHATGEVARLMFSHQIVAWGSHSKPLVLRICATKECRDLLVITDRRFTDSEHIDKKRAIWHKLDFAGSKVEFCEIMKRAIAGIRIDHHEDLPAATGHEPRGRA